MDRNWDKGHYNMNYPDFFLTKIGFNNPKKTYFIYADDVLKDKCSTAETGAHHGYIFLKAGCGSGGRLYSNKGMKQKNKKHSKERVLTLVHELIHTQGPPWPCTKGERNGHTATGILGKENTGAHLINLYGDAKKGCPDLKDSVYLTPTSEDPYDPLEIQCALAKKARGVLQDYDFKIPDKYNHKKLINYKGDWFCTYNYYLEADEEWFN